MSWAPTAALSPLPILPCRRYLEPAGAGRPLGDLITAGIGLAVAIRIWQVFPFAFHGSAAWWSTAIRVLLILVIVSSAIGIVVQAVSLARRATHQTRTAGA